jgi:hypothetical protein
MNKLVAAYDLGLNILMVRYNARYYARWPRDRHSQDKQGIGRSLNWIVDDLHVLADESVDASALRNSIAIVGDLHLKLAAGHLKADGVSRGAPKPASVGRSKPASVVMLRIPHPVDSMQVSLQLLAAVHTL